MSDTPLPDGPSFGWIAAAAGAVATTVGSAFTAVWTFGRRQNNQLIEGLHKGLEEQKSKTAELTKELKKCESTHKESDKRLAVIEERQKLTEASNKLLQDSLKKTNEVADAAIELSGDAIDMMKEVRQSKE